MERLCRSLERDSRFGETHAVSAASQSHSALREGHSRGLQFVSYWVPMQYQIDWIAECTLFYILKFSSSRLLQSQQFVVQVSSREQLWFLHPRLFLHFSRIAVIWLQSPCTISFLTMKSNHCMLRLLYQSSLSCLRLAQILHHSLQDLVYSTK